MGVYIAPEIKDRVAIGDDLYTITDSGGKKKLTPSPTEVSEPGTEINKALLQPMADAIERMDADLVPYTLYWWRRRAVGGNYSESRAITSDGYSASTFNYSYSYLCFIFYSRASGEDGETTYATIQYASSVTCSSSGVVLKNPSTYNVSADDTVSTLQAKFAGRYVKGLMPNTEKVYYIPNKSYVVSENWESAQSGTYRRMTGYLSSDDPSRDTTDVYEVSSVYNETIGAWTLVSSDASDTYPHSGVESGMEYEYFGMIKDAALDALNVPPMSVINFTSANFSNNVYNVAIPFDRFVFAIYDTTTGYSMSAFGIAEKSSLKIFGISNAVDLENGNYNCFSRIDITIRQIISKPSFKDAGIMSNEAIKVTSTGLTINRTNLGYNAGVLGYMKV